MRKIQDFIWHQKSTTSGWALGDENAVEKCHCNWPIFKTSASMFSDFLDTCLSDRISMCHCKNVFWQMLQVVHWLFSFFHFFVVPTFSRWKLSQMFLKVSNLTLFSFLFFTRWWISLFCLRRERAFCQLHRTLPDACFFPLLLCYICVDAIVINVINEAIDVIRFR